MAEAICWSCGAEKDLPLGRCPAGHIPTGDDRVVSVVVSTRVMDGAALSAAAARIQRGEVIRPKAELLSRARALLSGRPEVAVDLTPGQVALLVAGNVILTPMLGWALWFRWRARPGRGAHQALAATAPISAALAVVWVLAVL